MSKTPIIVTQIEVWPIDRLTPYAKNPLTHPDQQVAQISISIQENGMVNPILVDKNGNIIAGHGRVLGAQLAGLTELPVIVLDHLTEVQARALRIADNKIAENSCWDEKKLYAELAALLEEKIDLTSLGFSELELKRVLAELDHQSGHTDDDAVPDPPTQPITILGDLWNLPCGDEDGNVHRILCGDSTSVECLNQVLEGHTADLVYADAPYNCAYSSSGSAGRKLGPILNDNLGKDFGKFLADSCAAILAVSGGAIYISMSSSELHTLYQAFTQAGGHWSTYIVWVKDAFTLGRSSYQRLYEPILFGWKQGGPHFFCGARNLGDVWFIDKPRRNDLHPTMKPVELVERAILHSSKRGDLVLDPFAGAGCTLIACTKTSRRARLIELDPKYVDATITRWESYTRREAVLASNGRSFRDITLERHGLVS
jgi:DNA modification methylase